MRPRGLNAAYKALTVVQKTKLRDDWDEHHRRYPNFEALMETGSEEWIGDGSKFNKRVKAEEKRLNA